MFIGLNGVRILSIIALILVFASNIVTLVHDIQAVNKFLAEGRTVTSSGQAPNATMEVMMSSDYILCVPLLLLFVCITHVLAGEAVCRTNQRAPFGLS